MKFNLNYKKAVMLGASLMIAATSASSFASSSAGNYPEKPIKLVVGYAPGGGADIAGRLMAEQLTKALGVTVVVENRPGGGQNIGASHVARSSPDGYTLFMSSSALAVNPSIYKNLDYDAIKDFEPIAVFSRSPNLLVVRAASDIKSVADLVSYAKKNPNAINYSSAGSGSTQHLSSELFKIKAGINATHIPYRGTGPSINALIAGDVNFSFMNIPSASPQIKGGSLRPIAITSSERSSVLPDLPTMAEAGIQGMDIAAWYGILAPKGTPEPIITKLNKAINDIIKNESFREKLISLGADPISNSPAYFKQFLIEDNARWKEVVEQAGITAN